MAATNLYKKFLQGIGLIPKASTTNAVLGDLEALNDNRLHFFGASNDAVTTDAVTTTLTNKTIAAGSNTVTGLTNSNLSGTAAITNANLANMASSSSTVGTIKGNISGSATTPSDVILTSANTISSAVYRDGSGNFSAGTITAALTGNATNITGTVAIANGGTNITSYTTGDTLYASGTNILSKLSAGTNGTVLTMGASVPAWTAPGALIVQSKTGSYTALITDSFLNWDTSGGAGTLTLPTAVGNSGVNYRVNLKTAGNLLTINTTSSQTIGGYTSGTLKMGTVNDYVNIYSDGTNWEISAFGIYIGCRYTDTSGGSIGTSPTTTKFTTVDYDVLSLYNTSTGIFTAPIAGEYEFLFQSLWNSQSYSAGQGGAVAVSYGSGPSSIRIANPLAPVTGAQNLTAYGSVKVRLAPGGTASFNAKSDVATTFFGTAGFNALQIARVGN